MTCRQVSTTIRPMMNTTNKPASSGTCGVVGCSHAADFETQRRSGPSTWTVSLSCIDHAPQSALDAMLSA